MRRIALVRRRDGSTVAFDQHRIRDVVHRALLAAGSGDRLYADEIASMVELFLEKTYHDEIPTTAQIDDMVERVLIETGRAAAAKAFILHREQERRLREARDVRGRHHEPSLFETRVIQVDDAAAGESAPYSRERLARTLVADRGVARDIADEVVADVEAAFRSARVRRVPAALVRSLADAALLARAPELDVRRQGTATLAASALAAAVQGRASGSTALPGAAAARIGGLALRSHALSDLLPADVACDHLDGALHVHGLTSPTSLFHATLTPADVLGGRAPGAVARAPLEAGRSGRRLAAALGRATRWLGAATVQGVTLDGVPAAFGALTQGASREDVIEEAWHVAHEVAGDGASSPPRVILAAARDESPSAARFANALLRTLARPDGLPPRSVLPRPVVHLSERMLEPDGPWRRVVERAAAAAADGAPVSFRLQRSHAGGPRVVAGRVTLNLPRAAARVGRRNVEGFLRACDSLVERAIAAHVSRRGLLARAAAAPGGVLAPILRGGRGRAPLVDLAECAWSVGVTGLNEAVLHLTGFELHDGAEQAVRVARRVLSYLALRVREAGLVQDLEATLDADDDDAVARRLFACDARLAPLPLTEAFPGRDGYTPGVATRIDASADLLARISAEQTLHESLSGATLRLGLTPDSAGGAAGVVAVLTKLLRVGRIEQVEVAAW